MKLLRVWIENFKNLNDFTIRFPESSVDNEANETSITVLIGWNGTGKSNLFEAIVVIFRDLDLGHKTNFGYEIDYICHGNRISIKNVRIEKSSSSKDDTDRPATVTYRLEKKIDPITFVLSPENQKADLPFIPTYVFAYYSGPSGRLSEYFEEHKRRYYDAVIHPEKGKNLRDLKSLRRFFFAENHHSKYVLLAFFLKDDEKIKKFLSDYLRIVGLESVLFIMKEPFWAKNKNHLWGAEGLPKITLEKLYEISLAPMRLKQRVSVGIKNRQSKEFYYLYVKDVDSLNELAKDYDTPNDFFASLESTDLSEVIEDVVIKVKLRNQDGTLTFRELSEGEQQLLTVLGLLRFTKENESLILLDEPDTHLNPHWGVKYIDMLREIVNDERDVTSTDDNRHVLMATHDPLAISILEKENIQIFKRDKDDHCYSEMPEMSPKGLGFTGILTSDMFGFRSDLDPATLAELDRKVYLSGKDILSGPEKQELEEINTSLDNVGLLTAFSDPYYSEFVKAWSRKTDTRKHEKPFLTAEDRIDQAAMTDEILEELLKEK